MWAVCTCIHESDADSLYVGFNVLCYASGFFMLLFLKQNVCACVCVVVIVIVHWHCSAQLSMLNMEKRYRNKIIINL